MKTERLNCAIFILYCVAFVLQAVGYLAPAWFVKEYRVQHGAEGFLLDGKRFVLIEEEPMNSNLAIHGSLLTTPDDGMGLRKRSLSLDKDTSNADDGVEPIENDGNKDSDNGSPMLLNTNLLSSDLHISSDADNENENEDMADLPISNLQSKPSTSEAGETEAVNENGVAAAPHSNDSPMVDENFVLGTIVHTDVHSEDQGNDQVSNTGMVNTNEGDTSLFETPGSMKKEKMTDSFLKRKRILHVTAGLWYGRACVNSRNLLTTSDESEDTEWCALYIRTNESALDNQKDVFEFRIEASIGLGICLVGMLVASSACCVQSRQGTRMVLSLICMFLSGAVMLVPVVHMIVQHQQLSGLFHRKRVWSRFMVHTYVQHDLFDHWSVILCGCGSILSVLGAVIFTAIGCRNQRPAENIYDISRSEKGTAIDDLPVNWARTDKINELSGKININNVPDISEDDSDYHTETKEESCPLETFTLESSSSMGETNVDTGSGNDVVIVEEADNETLEVDSENDVDYFETAIDKD